MGPSTSSSEITEATQGLLFAGAKRWDCARAGGDGILVVVSPVLLPEIRHSAQVGVWAAMRRRSLPGQGGNSDSASIFCFAFPPTQS